jgi:hypothetical protein
LGFNLKVLAKQGLTRWLFAVNKLLFLIRTHNLSVGKGGASMSLRDSTIFLKEVPLKKIDGGILM